MAGLHRFCRVAAGGAHSLLVTERAEVLAWGSNSHGQVGNASVEDTLFPTAVVESGRAQFVFAGRNSSMMIDVDGWGHNEYGQLGDGTQQKRRTPTPTPLPGDVRATVVAAGSYHSLVLTETGEVLAAGFGYTKAGQQFLQVIRTGVTMVVSGTSHNLALTKTGTVLAWGANDHGQVGNGLLDFQPTPTAVERQQLIIAAGGCQSFCANEFYFVKAWGHGVVPVDDRSYDCPARYSVAEPTELFIPDGAFAIAAGDDHAVIVGSLGQVGCYDANMCGQVGNDSTVDMGRIMQVLPGGTVEILSAEARLAAAMKGPTEEYMLDNPAEESERHNSGVVLTLGPPAERPPQNVGEGGGVPIIMRQAAGVPISQDLVSHGPKTASE